MTPHSKVLIIAYHFPPDAAVGALRPQKFVKYLPQYGWQPHVLTIERRSIGKEDPARLDDVAGVPVCRTRFIRTPLQFLLDTRDRFRGGGNDDGNRGGGGQQGTPVQQNPSATTPALWKRLLGIALSLNWLPDDKVYWNLSAVIAGYRLIRRERIRCIYATAPPHSAGLLAAILARLTGCRLLLDLRDPWSLTKKLPPRMENDLYHRLDRRMESWVIGVADRVVVATENYRRRLIADFSGEPAGKFSTIENGFDEDDLPPAADVPANRKFTISYLGTFYLDRNPRPVLAALKQLIEAGLFRKDDLELRLIGDVERAGGESVRAMVDAAGLTECVTLVGKVPYTAALAEMVRADVLLLLAPRQPYQVPAKAYEYLSAGRPVLALTEEGATAELIRRTDSGLIARADDVSSIVAALSELYRNRGSSRFRISAEDRNSFSRRVQTGALATLLAECS